MAEDPKSSFGVLQNHTVIQQRQFYFWQKMTRLERMRLEHHRQGKRGQSISPYQVTHFLQHNHFYYQPECEVVNIGRAAI